MEVRWEWLQPLITAPYVPTLGPVHPSVVTPGLFADVLAIAGTGRFLPYDKDRRWADSKDSQVLAGHIIQEPGLVLIPTLHAGGVPSVKVHVYRRDPQRSLARAADLANTLGQQYGVSNTQVVWFVPPGREPDTAAGCVRIQMQTFNPGPVTAPEPGVVPLDELTEPVGRTFGAFAEQFEEGGFAFLDTLLRANRVAGPVLTCEREGRIVGAIGPMEIMPDRNGAARLLPQYFGVVAEYRRLGLGRRLWRAAVQWGKSHHASYQLLQTPVGGASDTLCRSEGLTDIGLVCKAPSRSISRNPWSRGDNRGAPRAEG